ncbi:MAG: DUF2332 domain-containing protein [Pseudomonadota bacterium]
MSVLSKPLPLRLADAFSAQATACAELRSNFSALLCALLARDGVPEGPVHDKLSELTNSNIDLGPSGASVPLRFLGALHRLVLDGTSPALVAAYPPHLHPGETGLASVLNEAIVEHGEAISGFLANAPQTNETGRSAALAPAFALLAKRYGLPFKVSELGASAGLNLNWPLYHIDYGQWSVGAHDSDLKIDCRWHGPTLEPTEMLVADAQGCDVHPMLLETQQQRNALLAYIWPEQPERLARLKAALTAAAKHVPDIVAQDAATFVKARLKTPSPGQCHVIYHTIAWQYFPQDQQLAAGQAIEEAAALAKFDAPLVWLRFEADNHEGGKGAKLDMTIWDGTSPEGRLIELGRADFHGRWVQWTGGKALEA